MKLSVRSLCSVSEKKVKISYRWKILPFELDKIMTLTQQSRIIPGKEGQKVRLSMASLSRRLLMRCGKTTMTLTIR